MSAGLGSRVLAAYAGEGRRTRLLVRLRWATCPFPALVEQVAGAGRLLDWGCGHGVMALAAALANDEVTVVGTDVDEAKLAVARRAAAAAGVADRVTFEASAPDALPTGTWDAVVVADVLYLLDPQAQRDTVAAAAAAVAPGGVLVVKETAPRPRWKAALSRLQEQVAVHVARITRSSDGVPGVAPPEEVAAWAAAVGLDAEVVALDRGYHVAHAAVVARRARVGPPTDKMPS